MDRLHNLKCSRIHKLAFPVAKGAEEMNSNLVCELGPGVA
jgi:hypothetical protein